MPYYSVMPAVLGLSRYYPYCISPTYYSRQNHDDGTTSLVSREILEAPIQLPFCTFCLPCLHLLADVWQNHLHKVNLAKIPQECSLLLVEGGRFDFLAMPKGTRHCHVQCKSNTVGGGDLSSLNGEEGWKCVENVKLQQGHKFRR